MKAYTDIEQSKKLAEILPLESADMARCGGENVIMTDYISAKKKFSVCGELTITPCWSQAALYDRLPVVIGNLLEKNALRLRIDKGETDFNVWYDNLDTGSVEEGLDVVESNPVDAYFEMIIRLKENNKL